MRRTTNKKDWSRNETWLDPEKLGGAESTEKWSRVEPRGEPMGRGGVSLVPAPIGGTSISVFALNCLLVDREN